MSRKLTMRCAQPPQGVRVSRNHLGTCSFACRAPAAAGIRHPAGTVATPSAAPASSRAQHVVARSAVDPDELHETKLGPNVAAGIKEVKEGLTWKTATVIRNECVVSTPVPCSLDEDALMMKQHPDTPTPWFYLLQGRQPGWHAPAVAPECI